MSSRNYKLNPHDNEQSRKTYVDNFDWSDTTLTLFERQKVDEFLSEFQQVFARHRFDNGTNREFKVELTHNVDRPAYSRPPNLDQPKRRHHGRTRPTSQV